jgi:hypothetical protein
MAGSQSFVNFYWRQGRVLCSQRHPLRKPTGILFTANKLVENARGGYGSQFIQKKLETIVQITRKGFGESKTQDGSPEYSAVSSTANPTQGIAH